MSKKLQLNLRMDKEPELLQKMKVIASENDMSLNDFAIAAFKAMVELRSPIKLSRMIDKLNSLDQKIANLEDTQQEFNERISKLETKN